jgi:hypothetical protein
MKSKKLGKNVILFTFPTQKSLALSFFRVQEYYESPKSELKSKIFSIFDFLDAMMTDSGDINYWAVWTGFNIPGNVFNSWKNADFAKTPLEIELIKKVESSNFDGDKYYVIAATESDAGTITHEIAHALYYLKNKYKSEMDEITESFKVQFPSQYKIFVKNLLKMGYTEEVIVDEIQAYMSEADQEYIKKHFKLDWNSCSKNNSKFKLQDFQKEYIEVLQKYNKYKW